MPYFDLVFNIPSDRVFSYLGDERAEAETGKRAMVPFGRRDCMGFIIGSRETPPQGIKEDVIKPIRRLVDKEPIFDSRDLELAKWIAGYYFCGLGEALAAMIPSGRRAGDYPTLSGEEDISATALELSVEQQNALDTILTPNRINVGSESGHPTFYLFGITGSGKTEVFLRAAETCLREGKSVIYLVPEISLTHQTVGR